jgi:hypothetical protein
MADSFSFDPVTGERSSGPAPGVGNPTGTFDGAVAAAWNPPGDLQSSDPHGQPPFSPGPFEPGELPCNVVAGDGDVGMVDADFGGAYDCTEPPDNIVV